MYENKLFSFSDLWVEKKQSAGFFYTHHPPFSRASFGRVPSRCEGETLRSVLILSSDMAFDGGSLNFRLVKN